MCSSVTQKASVLDMSLPSKLTSYFMTGRPVIASVAAEGGTAKEVLRSGAGSVVAPEDPKALLAEIRSFADDPEGASRLGAHGPHYAERHLSSRAGLDRITALLRPRAAPRRGGPVVIGRRLRGVRPAAADSITSWRAG